MGEYQVPDLSELVLSTPRLTLRPWRAADADVVFAAMQDRRMHEFLILPDPYTRTDAYAFVTGLGDEGRSTGTGIGCALEEKATGRVVGSAALRLPQPRHVSAEVGYALYPTGRGQGYASEAARALADWAFGHGVQRVEVICAVTNLASAQSALRAGFRYEGAHRRDVATPRGPVDGAVFGRLAGEPGDPVAPVAPPLPEAGLSDGTVLLRVLLPEDTDALAEQEADPLTRKWEFWSAPRTMAEHVARCASARLQWLVGPTLHCAIVDVATGRYAGLITIRLAGPPKIGGVGYVVHPAFRGRGYTARALRLLRHWAFEHGGFARLELGAKTENVASQRAALSGGFSPDGIREARLRNPDGSFSDEVRFAAVNPAVRSHG